MKLAINYSPQAGALLERGEIDPDLFKCPDWDDLVAAAERLRPVYVHFPLATGGGGDAPDWGRVDALMARTGTPHLNVHLKLRAEDVGATEDAAGRLARDVERLAARVGAERVVVENVIYRGRGGDLLRAAAEPDTIRRVVEATGCGLLLDLSHARISAYHLGVEDGTTTAWDYLDALPTHRLRELHLTGIRFHRERLTDHLPFGDDDWEAIGGALDRVRRGAWRAPEIVAVEYGGVGPIFAWRSEEGVIREQLPRLAAMVRDADAGLGGG